MIQPFADTPAQNYAGVVTAGFAAGTSASGSLRFRGSGSLQWTKDRLSLGWQTRYLSGYYLTLDRSVVAAQGSAKVASQMYHDMNISYRLPQKMTVRFGINNIFNKMPPLDVTQARSITARTAIRGCATSIWGSASRSDPGRRIPSKRRGAADRRQAQRGRTPPQTRSSPLRFSHPRLSCPATVPHRVTVPNRRSTSASPTDQG